MFDVGFTELVLIGLVALLVLGPTKMMEVARFTGRWAGRLRRQFQDVKEDIDRELQLEDMRRRLADEERALRDNLDVKVSDADPLKELTAAINSAEVAASEAGANGAAAAPETNLNRDQPT